MRSSLKSSLMKPDAVEKWTAIIEAARKHPQGVKEYCDENKISHSFYYVQFKKLKPLHPEWSEPVSRQKRKTRTAAQLPRRCVVHELTAAERCCPGCGDERQVIGEIVSERLAYFPALVQVIEDVRMKYACKQCAEHVAVAAPPAKPIPKGLADATMLAYIATSKFADHIPLHRLEGIFRRHGAEIARSTMCDWLAATADLLLPIYERMKSRILMSRILWSDDTPLDM